MSPSTRALEAVFVGLRDPLARIALAVGELDARAEPHSGVPKDIRDAVAELDARIEDALGGIQPGSEERLDLREALSRVIADLAPIFGARGIALTLAVSPGGAWAGDPSLLRRAVLRVLLGFSDWMDTRAGRVEVGMRGEERRVVIQLTGSVDGTGREGYGDDPTASLRGIALGREVEVEVSQDPGAGWVSVCLSLPAEGEG